MRARLANTVAEQFLLDQYFHNMNNMEAELTF
jgi:hypothetical protein